MAARLFWGKKQKKKINNLAKNDTHKHQMMQFYLSVRFILCLIRFYPIRIQYMKLIQLEMCHDTEGRRFVEQNVQKTKAIAQKHDLIVHRRVNSFGHQAK